MNGGEYCEPIENLGCFPIDTTLQLTGNFITTLNGQLGDPSSITLFLTAPGQPQQTLAYPAALVRVGAGVYTYTVTPSESGLWLGTWQGTGVIMATRDFSFQVMASMNIPG